MREGLLPNVLSWGAGILGVIAIAYVWMPPAERNAAPPEPSAASASVAPAAGIAHSRGRSTVQGTGIFDLDVGRQAEGLAQADIWWRQKTQIERSLVARNGAAFHVVGIRDFESLTYGDIAKLKFTAEEIPGDANDSNRLAQGTVVAYRTKEARLGKLLIEGYGYDLDISWVTYK